MIIVRHALAEHRRGYGSLYGALNHGRLDVDRLRDLLASVPLPRFGGRIALSVDVSPWLRSDAACSPEGLFCHHLPQQADSAWTDTVKILHDRYDNP